MSSPDNEVTQVEEPSEASISQGNNNVIPPAPKVTDESGEKSDSGEEDPTTTTSTASSNTTAESDKIAVTPKESKTNLIINYLPPSMSEGVLATLFSPYGIMENCKIVVDLNTGKSKGYGFVKYKSDESATRAREALNGFSISGKTLKVAFARPHCKEITNSNLFVTQLPKTYTKEDLRRLFRKFGKLIECKVLYDENQRSRSVGFVRFDTHQHAVLAKEAVDGMQPKDAEKPIRVKLATKSTPKSSRRTPSSRSPRRFQFPNSPRFTYPPSPMTPSHYSFSYHTPRGSLHGPPVLSPRYAPQSPHAYPMVMPPASPYGVDPFQHVFHYPRTPASARGHGHYCLFVYNIPDNHTEDQLKLLFEPYGKVASVRIIKNVKTNKPKGYGFVNFVRYEAAERAVRGLDGHKVGNRVLQVRFKNERPMDGPIY